MRYKEELAEQESKLSRSLSRVYAGIKRDLQFELSTGRISWQDITKIYRPRTEDLVRSAVNEIYRLTAQKVTERDIKVPFFLTQRDFQEIRLLSQKYTDWAWRGLESEIVRKTAMAFDPNTLMRLREDPTKIKLKDTFISRTTASLSSQVAATAVKSKAIQIISPNRLPSNYRMAALDNIPVYIWTTEGDERLCQICEPLEGRQWEIEDPSVPIPVSDTHINCRCRLELANAEMTDYYDSLEDSMLLESEQLI